MWYRLMVALTFASTDSVKHFLHRRSPEYGLKKKASLVLQALQTGVSIGFPSLGLIGELN
jgi:hypothetical protein